MSGGEVLNLWPFFSCGEVGSKRLCFPRLLKCPQSDAKFFFFLFSFLRHTVHAEFNNTNTACTLQGRNKVASEWLVATDSVVSLSQKCNILLFTTKARETVFLSLKKYVLVLYLMLINAMSCLTS